MNASQSVAVYKQAKANLTVNPDSMADRFIVNLWEVSAKLAERNQELMRELDETKLAAASYYRQVDQLGSQVAKLLNGTTEAQPALQ